MRSNFQEYYPFFVSTRTFTYLYALKILTNNQKMSDSKVYQPVWNKYMAVLILKIKEAVKKGEPQSFTMDKIDFESASSRKNAKYQFNVEMKEGRIAINKNNAAIARDFVRAINEHDSLKEIVRSRPFKFVLDSKFALTITANWVAEKAKEEVEAEKA